jgi:outer membrane usher protein
VVRASFNTRVGNRVLMTLTQNGKPLPFGATVTTEDKDSEFIVGNDGQTYLSGMPQRGTLSFPGDRGRASTASLNMR